ncbi:hypothetical protein B7463_g10197, partial [Scytalidium lignicola]
MCLWVLALTPQLFGHHNKTHGNIRPVSILRQCGRLDGEAARHALRLGAIKLILGIRNIEKGKTAKEDLATSTGVNRDSISVWKLDMDSFESVQEFAVQAAKFVDNGVQLDVAIMNAGMASGQWNLSVDGWEKQLQVNALSTALLSLRLLPLLIRNKQRAHEHAIAIPHLVIVASDIHTSAKFPERHAEKILQSLNDRTQWERSASLGGPAERYSVTKLLDIYITIEIAKMSELLTREQAPVILKVLQWLIGRDSSEGSKAVIDAAIRGVESHGKWLENQAMADPGEIVSGERQAEIRERLWKEILFNTWICLRIGALGSLFTNFIAILILLTPDMDPAVAGFVLTFALNSSGFIISTIRYHTDLELGMNTIERIVEYIGLPTKSLGGKTPPAAWPAAGCLEVNDLVASYAADLPPVLRGVTFGVNPNERIGVMGQRHREIADYISSNFKIHPKALTYGDGSVGSNELRQNIANFMNATFRPKNLLILEHVTVLAGVSSVIDTLAFCVAEKGDGILLGRPTYVGFISDMVNRAEVKPVLVGFQAADVDPTSLEVVKCYEEALIEANTNGTPVKALLFCNPHNPFGRFYPTDVIKAYLQLCSKYNIHFISDEVYANSVFSSSDFPNPPQFESVLSLNIEEYISPSLVHCLYGMSKDFCSNGIRVGVFVSQNNTILHAAIRAVSKFAWTSSLADSAWSAILADQNFLDEYFQKLKSELSEAYNYCVRMQKEREIPYMARFLQEPTVENERELAWKMIQHGVWFATGEAYRSEKHGWFRLTFAVDRAELAIGFERLDVALQDQFDLQAKLVARYARKAGAYHLTVHNTVSVQQLALMPIVHVLVLYASRTITARRIQNDEAQIGQMRGIENLRVPVVTFDSVITQTIATVPALVIPGIASLNNFGNIITTLALAPAAVYGPGSPCHVTFTWISLVGSFYTDGVVAYIVLAPGVTPALAPAPLAFAFNPLVLTVKP